MHVVAALPVAWWSFWLSAAVLVYLALVWLLIQRALASDAEMPGRAGSPGRSLLRGPRLWAFVLLALGVTGGGVAAGMTAGAGGLPRPETSAMTSSMGGGMLGGNARVRMLAQAQLAAAPRGPVVWLGVETRLRANAKVAERHGFTFVYGVSGMQMLGVGSREKMLMPGEAATVSALHSHAGDGSAPSSFWEVRLVPAGTRVPSSPRERRLFTSPSLSGIPPRPLAVFADVVLPSGGRTSVHAHPGPELIYLRRGRIVYRNAIVGVRELAPGATEPLPAGTAVQKRNPWRRPADFLSWFLVDPAKSFAMPARLG